MIFLPPNMPLIDILNKQNYEAFDYNKEISQGKIKIGILNLMPLKEITEYHFAKILASYSKPIELFFLKLESHQPKNTAADYLNKFYFSFLEKINDLDIIISTGAPIEELPFESVTYWEELKEYFQLIEEKKIPFIGVCWSAQAALKFYSNIEKENLKQKDFGIFEQLIIQNDDVLKGFNEKIFLPISRHSKIIESELQKKSELKIILNAKNAGVFLLKNEVLNHFYIAGHPEYGAQVLGEEYARDIAKGRNDVAPPINYSLENPTCFWDKNASQLYHNIIAELLKNKPKPAQ